MNKVLLWLTIAIVLIVGAFFIIKQWSSPNNNRFIGIKNIPCLEGVHVKFYQSTESFVKYQGLKYVLVSPSGRESEWHTLGGTDDFDGALLSDFEIKCNDSNVVISYGETLTDSFKLRSIL